MGPLHPHAPPLQVFQQQQELGRAALVEQQVGTCTRTCMARKHTHTHAHTHTWQARVVEENDKQREHEKAMAESCKVQ